MAIYSLSLGFISRSTGRSSVGFSAYMSGSRCKDERTGSTYNYTSKKDVVISRILAPEGAPAWALNAHTLWNKAEQFEDQIASLRFRCDAKNPEKRAKSVRAKEGFLNSTQTAQTVMGALPLELNQSQSEALVEEFLNKRFVSRELVVQYAIHWDAGNPHFHGMITRRPLMKGEFSKRKDHEIVSRIEHRLTRKLNAIYSVGNAWKSKDSGILGPLTLARKEAALRLLDHEIALSLFKTLYPIVWRNCKPMQANLIG